MFTLESYNIADRLVLKARDAQASPFGHHLGGNIKYSGFNHIKNEPAIHMLARVGLGDPALSHVPKVARWIPLLCAIRYGACNIGYHVINDSTVNIFYVREQQPWRDFPYPDFPDHLPDRKFIFEPHIYEPSSLSSVLEYYGIFRDLYISSDVAANLRTQIIASGEVDVGGWLDVEDYLQNDGCCLPFRQGVPKRACIAPNCGGVLSPLFIFAQDASESHHLWGKDCGNLQIVYQICDRCHAIVVTNQP